MSLYFVTSVWFKRLKKDLRLLLVDDDSLGPGWQGRTESEKVADFSDWITARMSRPLAEGVWDEQLWGKYVAEVYAIGARRAYEEFRRTPSGRIRLRSSSFPQDSAQFVREVVSRPESAEHVSVIVRRALSSVSGMKGQLVSSLSRVVADSLANKSSRSSTYRTALATVDGVGVSRVRTTVRTELSRAQADGQVDSFLVLGVKALRSNVERTSGGEPCARCASLGGRVVPIESARGTIPHHPNCICSWSIATEGGGP